MKPIAKFTYGAICEVVHFFPLSFQSLNRERRRQVKGADVRSSTELLAAWLTLDNGSEKGMCSFLGVFPCFSYTGCASVERHAYEFIELIACINPDRGIMVDVMIEIWFLLFVNLDRRI